MLETPWADSNPADVQSLNCGIPQDAEYFDVAGFVGMPRADGDLDAFGAPLTAPFQDLDLSKPEALPRQGESTVLARFQLHSQYCGILTYFSQYTDLYFRDCTQILTPGFEWTIRQNGKPLFPYTRLEAILNPWGYNNYQVAIRLDENALVEFLLRNRGVRDEWIDSGSYPIYAFGGRLMGRYWYNAAFGSRIR